MAPNTRTLFQSLLSYKCECIVPRGSYIPASAQLTLLIDGYLYLRSGTNVNYFSLAGLFSFFESTYINILMRLNDDMLLTHSCC